MTMSSTECITWQGGKQGRGYGMTRDKGKRILAHRLAWERVNGPIPLGWHVDHLCRNRACVNPDHMELVTPRENVLRGASPAAAIWRARVCARGHEFSEANTYTTKDGHHHCRVCRRMTRSSEARNKQEDWTKDKRGRSNSSARFLELVETVAQILDADTWNLSQGRDGRRKTARLIVAWLAHKSGVAPGKPKRASGRLAA